MNRINLAWLTLFIIVSCSSPAVKENDKNKKDALYPYPQYILSQIAYLDTVPLGIEMIVQENGVTIDSGFIDRKTFRDLANNFLQPDPNQKALRPQYEEISFQDLTLNTITFSITTKNQELPLQQADILLNPDTRIVKYLVLKKQQVTNDGYSTSSLMWRHNMNFQIVTSVTGKDGKERSRLIRVVWDKPVAELSR
jgi:hypothetical protein